MKLNGWWFFQQQVKNAFTHSELRIYAYAIVLAVLASSTVNYAIETLNTVFSVVADQVKGSDLTLISNYDNLSEVKLIAQKQGLISAESMRLSGVAKIGEEIQLVSVKAVSPDYPLYGAVRVYGLTESPQTAVPATAMPQDNEIWVNQRLINRLPEELANKQPLHLSLGGKRFTISAILLSEPSGDNPFLSAAAPMVMTAQSALVGNQLLGPGARVRYRLYLAGEAQAISEFRQKISNELPETARYARDTSGVNATFDRASRFLRLIALLTLTIALSVLVLTARGYAMRQIQMCAIWRSLGANSRFLQKVFWIPLITVTLLATLAGLILGFLLYKTIFSWLLAGQQTLGALSYQTLAVVSIENLIIGLAMSVAVGWPCIRALVRIKPAYLLRNNPDKQLIPIKTLLLSSALVLLAIVTWATRDQELVFYALGGIAVGITVMTLLAMLILKILDHFSQRSEHLVWRMGLGELARRRLITIVQFIAFGWALTTLLILLTLRFDLLESWLQELPADAPNRFLVNILPDQKEPIGQLLGKFDVTTKFQPMIRGRITAINGQTVNVEDYAQGRARSLLRREYNLSWSEHLPKRNNVIEGQWFSQEDHGQPLLSVEQDMAELLGLNINDQISFTILGEEQAYRVANIRSLRWDSMQVNFYVIAPPGIWEDVPSTYVSSFYLASNNKDFERQLVRQFPNVSVIDVTDLIARARELINTIATSVQLLLGLALLTAFAVVAAALRATWAERGRNMVVLRTLGASKKQLVRIILTEYGALGAVVGFMSSLIALFVGAVVSLELFELPMHYNIPRLAYATVFSALGFCAVALLALRAILHTRPTLLLRQING